jgi:diguanylate cyclase (GGDEF)-like protein
MVIPVDNAAAHRTVRALNEIIDAAAGVLAEQSLQSTLLEMASALGRIVPYTSIAIYEVDWPARRLVPVFANGQYVDATLAERPSLDASITGSAVLRGEAINLDAGHPTIAEFQMPGTSYSARESFLVVPLMGSDRAIGTLNVWREGVDDAHFTEEEVELARRFATLAAIAWDNAVQRERLQRQALTDDLTGLSNRRHCFAELSAELARSRRDGGSVSLALLDLDDFKAINDGYGHPAGDAALRAVAEALTGAVRAGDVVCRIGGEEFAVILPGVSAEVAAAGAQRLLEAVRDVAMPIGRRLTVSAGVASAPQDGADAVTLLQAADVRLMRSKNAGKDRVTGPPRPDASDPRDR